MLNNSQIQKLLDTTIDSICTVDKSGLFISLNAACTNFWGYHPEELVGKPFLQNIVGHDHQTFTSLMHMEVEDIHHFKNHYRTKDGTVIPMIWYVCWDYTKEMMYYVACDARDKKEIEKALEQSNERFQLVSQDDALYDWNIATDNLHWGQGLLNTFGYHFHELQME